MSGEPCQAIWAIVPAAGKGQRMGGKQPKQYLSLMAKTLIEHTLGRLLALEALSGIVVALHPQDQYFNTLAIAQHPKVHRVIGGEARSDSVLAALDSLHQCLNPQDWVLVHDAARCCVLSAAIERLIQTLAGDEVGGILAVPVNDTVKHLNSEQKIVATLDRNSIWRAQTPQMFRYKLLRAALQQAQEQQRAITDEASALELAGYQPSVIMGHHDNIKITHPEDLAIAEAIMQQQLLKGQKG